MADVLVQACKAVDLDVVSGVCAAPFWTVQASSVFSGWAESDFAALIGGLLFFASVVYVIRLVHKFVLSL